MKRKRAKSDPKKAEGPAAPNAAGGATSLLPMELQIGDRFTDHGFDWELVSHPAVLHGGKSLRARIQRPGVPETERDMTWPAHVRIEIRRAQ